MTFAWDDSCYSEAWYIKGGVGLVNHTSICNGLNTTYALKKCGTNADTRTVSTLLKDHFSERFTVLAKANVPDPFYFGTARFDLWASAD